MPFTYQGTLIDRPARSFHDAIVKGKERLEDVPIRAIDLRVAFETLQELTQAMPFFDESAIGWVDLAVYPTEQFFHVLTDHIHTQRALRVLCLGKFEGLRVELSLEFEQPYIRRFDDRLCYESLPDTAVSMRAHLVPNQRSERSHLDNAHRLLHRFLLISGEHAPMRVHEALEGVEPTPKFDGGWLTIPPQQRTLEDSANFQLHFTDASPTGFSFRGALSETPVFAAIFCACVNQVKRIEKCHFRSSGTLSELQALCSSLDLHHDHEWVGQHRYGLTRILPPEQSRQATRLPPTSDHPYRNALEWDVRWRCHWSDSASMSATAETTSCRYTIRSSKGQPIDQLFIEIPDNDPTTPDFRSTRQALCSIFGDKLAKQSAWQFEGAVLNSADGRRNHAMHMALKAMAEGLGTQPTASLQQTPKPPGVFNSIARFLRKQPFPDLNFSEYLADSIAEALPGFRYDPKAHVSDAYYLEFYRRHTAGYDLIQIQRFRNPSRFRIFVGVCEFHIYLDDLVPSRNRTVPGLMVDFEELLPNGWENVYVLYSQKLRAETIDAAVAHLRHFGTPFFESARSILGTHSRGKTE